MKRLALCTLLVGCALAQPASAHMVWLERTGPTVQLFYGEPENDRREKTGAALDTIASPKLVGADAPVTRQPDHIAFGPLPAGDARAVEAGLPRATTANEGAAPAPFSSPGKGARSRAPRSIWNWYRPKRGAAPSS